MARKKIANKRKMCSLCTMEKNHCPSFVHGVAHNPIRSLARQGERIPAASGEIPALAPAASAACVPAAPVSHTLPAAEPGPAASSPPSQRRPASF